MFACDYAQANAKKKGVGLHYSEFQKPGATVSITCETKAPENRDFRNRIAEVGLTLSHPMGEGTVAQRFGFEFNHGLQPTRHYVLPQSFGVGCWMLTVGCFHGDEPSPSSLSRRTGEGWGEGFLCKSLA